MYDLELTVQRRFSHPQHGSEENTWTERLLLSGVCGTEAEAWFAIRLRFFKCNLEKKITDIKENFKDFVYGNADVSYRCLLFLST